MFFIDVAVAVVVALTLLARGDDTSCPSQCKCIGRNGWKDYWCNFTSGSVKLDSDGILCQSSSYNCSELPQLPSYTNSSFTILSCPITAEIACTMAAVGAAGAKILHLIDIRLSPTHNDSYISADFSFGGLVHLNFLTISSTNILNIGDNTLRGLDSLLTLDLKEIETITITLNAFKWTPLLKSLSIDESPLEMLQNGLLSNLKKFHIIVIHNNRVPLRIEARALAELPTLESVELINCSLKTLPSDLFSGSHMLKYLSFKQNQIELLPLNMLKDQQALLALDLRRNRLKEVNGLFFEFLHSLIYLFLDNNEIKVLHSKTFINQTSLEVLTIRNNRLRYINNDTFVFNFMEGANKLQKLLLDGNQLKLDNLYPFSKIQDLQLSLSHNNITSDRLCSQLPFYTGIKSLNLSHNYIQELTDHYYWNTEMIKIDFRHNPIQQVIYKKMKSQPSTQSTSVIYLDSSSFVCTCILIPFRNNINVAHSLGKPVYIIEDARCAYPPALAGRLLREVTPSDLVCYQSGCLRDCDCAYSPLVDINLKLTCDYPPSTVDIELLLTKFSGISFMFPKLITHSSTASLELRQTPGPWALHTLSPRVRSLHLIGLSLIEVPKLPLTLDLLDLRNNNLTQIPNDLLERRNLTLLLSENPIDCECSRAETILTLPKYIDTIKDYSHIHCANGTLLSTLDARSCFSAEGISLWVAIGIAVASLGGSTIIAILLYYYRYELIVRLHAGGWFLGWLRKEDLDSDKMYDAFIAFAHEDISFIMDELVPFLERQSPTLRLCLHYRDWTPGEFITTQVVSSVEKSRRTIVVVSEYFLVSKWGRLEFRVANAYALRESRVRVVVILLQDVTHSPALDPYLRAYFSTNTYLRRDDPRFWTRLQYALPHSRTKLS